METVKANVDSSYDIPANETHLYHLKLVKEEANFAKKTFEDRGVTQSYSVVDYNQMVRTGFFKNYDKVVILHNPTLKSVVKDAKPEPPAPPVDKKVAPEKKETAADKKKREAAEEKATKDGQAQKAANAIGQAETDADGNPIVVKDIAEQGDTSINSQLRAEYKALTVDADHLEGIEAPEGATDAELTELIETAKGF